MSFYKTTEDIYPNLPQTNSLTEKSNWWSQNSRKIATDLPFEEQKKLFNTLYEGQTQSVAWLPSQYNRIA